MYRSKNKKILKAILTVASFFLCISVNCTNTSDDDDSKNSEMHSDDDSKNSEMHLAKSSGFSSDLENLELKRGIIILNIKNITSDMTNMELQQEKNLLELENIKLRENFNEFQLTNANLIKKNRKLGRKNSKLTDKKLNRENEGLKISLNKLRFEYDRMDHCVTNFIILGATLIFFGLISFTTCFDYKNNTLIQQAKEQITETNSFHNNSSKNRSLSICQESANGIRWGDPNIYIVDLEKKLAIAEEEDNCHQSNYVISDNLQTQNKNLQTQKDALVGELATAQDVINSFHSNSSEKSSLSICQESANEITWGDPNIYNINCPLHNQDKTYFHENRTAELESEDNGTIVDLEKKLAIAEEEINCHQSNYVISDNRIAELEANQQIFIDLESEHNGTIVDLEKKLAIAEEEINCHQSNYVISDNKNRELKSKNKNLQTQKDALVGELATAKDEINSFHSNSSEKSSLSICQESANEITWGDPNIYNVNCPLHNQDKTYFHENRTAELESEDNGTIVDLEKNLAIAEEEINCHQSNYVISDNKNRELKSKNKNLQFQNDALVGELATAKDEINSLDNGIKWVKTILELIGVAAIIKGTCKEVQARIKDSSSDSEKSFSQESSLENNEDKLEEQNESDVKIEKLEERTNATLNTKNNNQVHLEEQISRLKTSLKNREALTSQQDQNIKQLQNQEKSHIEEIKSYIKKIDLLSTDNNNNANQNEDLKKQIQKLQVKKVQKKANLTYNSSNKLKNNLYNNILFVLVVLVGCILSVLIYFVVDFDRSGFMDMISTKQK